jgi:FtsZ-binding cell division protein ZapB
MNEKSVIQQPEAAVAVSSALATLSQVAAYTQVMISEELNLAMQIAELKRTETVLQATIAEISRKRQELEYRQQRLRRY